MFDVLAAQFLDSLGGKSPKTYTTYQTGLARFREFLEARGQLATWQPASLGPTVLEDFYGWLVRRHTRERRATVATYSAGLRAFVRFLALPTPAKLGREGCRGRELFSQIGCAACHVPTLRTGESPVPALRNKEFAAYTDLLLHDMGPDMADICLGLATPSEFRTEPLIDLRHADNYLHDGRAATLQLAIAAHGGEAAGARDRFKALPPGDQNALIAFLKSL